MEQAPYTARTKALHFSEEMKDDGSTLFPIGISLRLFSRVGWVEFLASQESVKNTSALFGCLIFL